MTPSSPNSLPSLTPDITPALPGQDRFETQTPFFDEVEILDDSLYIDPNKSTEDDTIHPISKITTSPLTTADLRKDPILSALAKLQLKDNDHHQSNVPSSSANSTSASAQFKTFKAKPAPGGMRDEGVGPRMTKSAALRLGIKWEDKREKNGRDGMGFENVPGHKRASMGIVSLVHLSHVPFYQAGPDRSPGHLRMTIPAEIDDRMSVKMLTHFRSLSLPCRLPPSLRERTNLPNFVREDRHL